MATLDEIFAAMPDAPAGGTHELLTIDPDARLIEVPEIESIFGVIRDGNAEKKYFQCPRYVGKGIDLAACKLRIAYQNASGTEEGRDGYLVQDLTESGGYVYFSWELSEKVCLYQGQVQFAVCATQGAAVVWNTTIATGTVLEGLPFNGEIVQTEMQDVIAQLIALVEAQSAAVEAAGAAAVKKVNAAAADTAPAIACQAEGAAIQVHNASDRPLRGLRIFGRSTQDGTPTPDNPVEIVSTPAPVATITDGTEENVQTLTITTPAMLPGVPVTSGGNYTDENGQQWICDEVDLGRGVYVQRVKMYKLAELKEWTTWGVNSKVDGITGFYHFVNETIHVNNVLCTIEKFDIGVWGGRAAGASAFTNDSAPYIGISVYNDVLADTSTSEAAIASFNKLIAETGGKMLACIKPTETPLSEAALAAFAALHSNKPTTNILNDSEAHMAVEYVADTKLYIDSKLAELVAAMNA